MKQIIKYMKGFEKQCILGPLFKLLEAGLELLVPLVVASIVDTGIGGGDKSYIIRMCLVLSGLGLVGLLCSVTAQYFAASAAVGFCTRLRHALLEHVLGLSYTQIDGLGTSTLITRMTSDINQVQSGVNLTLRLSPSADNSFAGGKCDVGAEIYAIQKENLEQDGSATNFAYIQGLIVANESQKAS